MNIIDQRRIGIFLPSLRGGGAERSMVTLANGMAKLGFNVDLLLAASEGPYLKDLDSNVRLVDFEVGQVRQALKPLAMYMREVHPRVVLSAMNHANIISIIARMIARREIRLVVSVRNVLGESIHRSSNRRERLIPWLMRALYPKADAIIAISNSVARDVEKVTKVSTSRIDVVYNPVVTESIRQLSNQRLDHPWFSLDAPPVILGAGRLTYQKDFPTLLKAFREVNRNIPSRLVILGKGEERKYLEDLSKELVIQEAVGFLGFVENPYVFMKNAAVFAQSSRWEGFGNVLVEAMACGTSLVSTDCPGGPKEILGDGKYGVLVPVGDYLAMAEAICKVLQNPLDPKILEEHAGEFTAEESIANYKKILFPWLQ